MKTGVCPGCLTSKSLVSSHLIPRAVYEYVRADELHPIVVGGGTVRATSDQLQAELLCAECEQILNAGGERWIVGKLCTFDRQFPLYDLLRREPPIIRDPDGDVFDAGKNPEVDVHSLCHFALSIFWKASVYHWGFGEISLGPYSEAIREWIRGARAFPPNLALNVTVSRPSTAQILINPPYETAAPRYHAYLLHVPGILFRLSVGKQIPLEEKILCLCSGTGRLIMVSDTATQKIHHLNLQKFKESTKTKSYEKASAKVKKMLGAR